MNRTLLLTAAAAGLLSVGIVGVGCEHESSSTSSSSSKPSTAMTTPSSGAQNTPGETAATSGQGPAGIDQQNATGAAAAARADRAVSAAAPSDNASAPATGDAAASASAAPAAGTSSVNQNQPQVGLGDTAQTAAAADKAADHHAMAMAVANVKPAGGAKDEKISGTVKFMAGEHGVRAMVDLKGMKPDSVHGFHIHEKGDLSSPDLKSAGGHFNPGGKKHGGPEGDMRHGGDLGNITADDKGNVKTEIMVHGISIDGEKDGIVGRSVVVHAKADDLKTDPAGNSGDRIAGGVIEKAKGDHAEHSEK